jgi:predicted phage gp36 major capsid-like protein
MKQRRLRPMDPTRRLRSLQADCVGPGPQDARLGRPSSAERGCGNRASAATITASVMPDGGFTVTNNRNGFARRYLAR